MSAKDDIYNTAVEYLECRSSKFISKLLVNVIRCKVLDVYYLVLEKDIVVVLYRTHNSALGTFALVLF